MPPPTAHAAASSSRPHDMRDREDFRLAKKSLKIIRKLCQDYGLGFSLPQNSEFWHKKRRRRRPAKPGYTTDEETDRSPTPSSSSSSSPSVWEVAPEEEFASDACVRWPEIDELFSGLHGKKRVQLLHKINKGLAINSQEAQAQLAELDELEKRNVAEASALAIASGAPRRSDSRDPSSATGGASGGVTFPGLDRALLRFRVEDAPVAHAVQRCIDKVPMLQRLAEQKAEQRARDLELQLEREEEEAQAAGQTSMDEDDDGLTTEVERKLRFLGDLPPESDPDLVLLLEAQRAEIRNMTVQIKEAERDLDTRRAALDYLEGKTPVGPDRDEARILAGRDLLNEMRTRLITEARAQAEKQAKRERELANEPTDGDVQAAVEEHQRLQIDVERASDHIKKLQDYVEKVKAAARSAEDDLDNYSSPSIAPTPTSTMSPRSNRNATLRQRAAEYVPKLKVPLAKAQEYLEQFTKERAVLDMEIAEEDARTTAAEGVLKNAAQTFVTIDEYKLLFLEHVAKMRPALVEELISKEANDSDSNDGLTSGDSDEDDSVSAPADVNSTDQVVDSAALLDPEAALVVEARALEAEIEQFRVPPAELRSMRTLSSERDMKRLVTTDEGFREARSVGDAWVHDIHRLASRMECLGSPRADADANGDLTWPSWDDASPEDAAWEAVSRMTGEEASLHLRGMPQEDVIALLRLHRQNADLLAKVERKEEEIEALRERNWASHELFEDFGVVGAMAPRVPPPPHLVSAVVAKARELDALRKRWWALRQDPRTTVRRALVLAGMPEADDADDEPPGAAKGLKVNMPDRILESMTLV